MNGPILHRGKLARHPKVLAVRPLVREDLAVLRDSRPPQGRVKTLRETHRRLARMVAAGFTNRQIGEITGYSTNRLLQLKADPAFCQLVAELRPEAEAGEQQVIDEYVARSFENAMLAQEMIGEHLNRAIENDELIPIRTLLPLTQDYGDRFGYGKHSSQTTEVKDFARMMEAAQARSGRGPVIDAQPSKLVSIPVGPNLHQTPTPQGIQSAPRLRRRV